MKLASFNINGIKARLPRLKEWLEETRPSVACLQEIKSQDEGFPASEFEPLGYQPIWHGQKAFNGVAILADTKAGYSIAEVQRGLGIDGPKEGEGEQARYLEVDVTRDGAPMARVVDIYLPNGNPQPGPKFDYKLAWMERLHARAQELLANEEIALMAGDYNVMPQAEDVARPNDWRDDALFLPQTRDAFQRILYLGFTDAYRTLRPGAETYTFWDYQAGAWNRDDGIRIDHFLLSPQAADLLTDCQIDKAIRGREKPSDHVPIWVNLDA